MCRLEPTWYVAKAPSAVLPQNRWSFTEVFIEVLGMTDKQEQEKNLPL